MDLDTLSALALLDISVLTAIGVEFDLDLTNEVILARVMPIVREFRR